MVRKISAGTPSALVLQDWTLRLNLETGQERVQAVANFEEGGLTVMQELM